MRQSVIRAFSSIGQGLAGFALLAFLGACSSSGDLMTPPADVGDGTGSVSSAPIYGAPQPSGQYQPVTAAGLPEPGYQQPLRGPQNTLEAQAQALEQGERNPSASRPLPSEVYQEFPAEPQAQTARAQSQPASQPVRQPTAASSQQASLPPASAAAAGSAGSIRFLPIIGAPVQAVTPLSRQLGAEARARGLTIKSANDSNSEHILKGYFSAFSDGGNVTITYVWDILDNSGARLHRIQGQETIPSGAKDPWAAVPASVMQQIATKSMAEYLQWRNSQAG